MRIISLRELSENKFDGEEREVQYYVILYLLKEQLVGIFQRNSIDIVILDLQTPEPASHLRYYESNGNKKP